MKILITGGTGFIGQMLCSSLKAKGHELCVLTRSANKGKRRLRLEGVRFIEQLSDISPDDSYDAVINLAGAPIAKRWTSAYKKIIINSRVEMTNRLIETISRLKQKPSVLISGSAIGYYGPQGDNPLSESDKGNASFSHDLCTSWEITALKANDLNVRVCLLRTGIVLGAHGGALQQMRLPFKCGLGGPIGNGLQWMSWIHIADMVRLIHFCLEKTDIVGPVNATAPNPARNAVFAELYAKSLHRKALLKMPAFIMRLLYGQMAEELLLTGQKVMPTKLSQHGFTFVYPDLELALLDIEHK